MEKQSGWADTISFLVNGLAGLIEKNQLIRTEDIHTLEDCGLGIDATHYIHQLYLRPSIKSSLSSALGGIPAAFRKEVEKDLANFQKLKSFVLFVFSSIDLNSLQSRDGKSFKSDPVVDKRRFAWDAWTKMAERERLAQVKEREELTRRAF